MLCIHPQYSFLLAVVAMSSLGPFSFFFWNWAGKKKRSKTTTDKLITVFIVSSFCLSCSSCWSVCRCLPRLLSTLTVPLRGTPVNCLPAAYLFHFFFPSSLLYYYMWLRAAELLAERASSTKKTRRRRGIVLEGCVFFFCLSVSLSSIFLSPFSYGLLTTREKTNMWMCEGWLAWLGICVVEGGLDCLHSAACFFPFLTVYWTLIMCM